MYEIYWFAEHLKLDQHSTFGKVDFTQRKCEKPLNEPVYVCTPVFT